MYFSFTFTLILQYVRGIKRCGMYKHRSYKLDDSRLYENAVNQFSFSIRLFSSSSGTN